MVNQKMYELGNKASCIRELFEYGKKQKSLLGEDKVFDFSIGNPSVSCPQEITDELIRLIKETDPSVLHSYTSAPGDLQVRELIAKNLNERFNVNEVGKNIYLTLGASASLTISLKALVNENDEVIIFAPYFPEYSVFIDNAGGKKVVVNPDLNTFYPNLKEFEAKINQNTKVVLINSPSNPTGVVYPEKVIKDICNILEAKQKEYNHPIYIICDEPYREIVFDNLEVPHIPNLYDDTIVCYSYSKSLSLPGERIGYVLVPNQAYDSKNLYLACLGAGRAYGYVCAPSLMQHTIELCADLTSDMNEYKKNRDLIYNGLTKIGYECVKPDGAFYLFMKALDDDAYKFMEKAKKYNIIVVPSDNFGVKGYVRLAYCVSSSTIINSMEAFKKLYKEYNK